MSEENFNKEQSEQSQENDSREYVDTILEDESFSDVEFNNQKKTINLSKKGFFLSVFIPLVAGMLATFMLTYTLLGNSFQKQQAEIYADLLSQSSNNSDEITVINKLLDEYFYGEPNKDKLKADSLKAYLEATGDKYAKYYTQEEIERIQKEDTGIIQGIGINVIGSTVVFLGTEYKVLKITNITNNSPAQKAGLKLGDLIYSVLESEKKMLVNDLDYDGTLQKLRGESGTWANFTVLRQKENGYSEFPFSIQRKEIMSPSVYYRVSTLDSKIGIVHISSFDLPTPLQFTDAIETLKSYGCEKFVLDVRYNSGGYLVSVAAILSYFLNEGDVYIRTEDKNKNITSRTIAPVSHLSDSYVGCNVKKEDIGKYKNLNTVILCNESTASAAELFTATFRDYNLGKIVGTTTFGKGKMQNTYLLDIYGLDGAVKFTTHMYYSAKSPGYDGIGIKPDEGCEVELSKEAQQYNIYDLPDDVDNQLIEAIKHFK